MNIRQVVLRTMWGTWAALVALWLIVSTVVYATQGDAGSFIGGGMVVGFWTIVITGATCAIQRIEIGEDER